MILGDNIRYLRTKKGMSQDYLAEQFGYKSFTTIQKWESGVSEPPVKIVKQLAALFDVDMNDMVNKDLTEGNTFPNKKSKAGVTINVLGRVAAGIPIDAIEEIIDTEEITEKLAKTGSYFGLIIKGDSMEPTISNGDVVIVRQQEDAENGEIVIVTVNGDEATCKRLRKYRDGIELVSINPSYEPKFFSNEEVVEKPVKIIGRVVEARKKF